MYSLLHYSAMIRDAARMRAYERALARVITPSSVVVDIGAGSGIASLMAARLGARMVHAIELNPAVNLLPELAKENDFSSRIRIHSASSFEVELPERADVIVSDVRGAFPLAGSHLALLRDARKRYLHPDGVLIPTRDAFFVAAFESYDVARRLALGADSFEREGFDARAVTQSVMNTRYNDADLTSIMANDLITSSSSWGQVEYDGSSRAIIEGTVTLETTRTGLAHGLAVWFRATLLDDITFENAPGTQMAYARIILPLAPPIQLEHGQPLSVTIRVDERGERWAWETESTLHGHQRRSRQASFFGVLTSPTELLRNSPAFAPTRNNRGEIAAFLLRAMDGSKSVVQLAELARAEFPESSEDDITIEARELLHRYGR